MPNFSYSQALTANQQGFDPLVNWQYRYAPYRCLVTHLVRATTVSARITVNSGSTTVQQKSPIQGGGTAGSTPTVFTTHPLQWVAEAGDLISLTHDEVGGLLPTVDGIVSLDPI
jgi:hypothetical protein